MCQTKRNPLQHFSKVRQSVLAPFLFCTHYGHPSPGQPRNVVSLYLKFKINYCLDGGGQTFWHPQPAVTDRSLVRCSSGGRINKSVGRVRTAARSFGRPVAVGFKPRDGPPPAAPRTCRFFVPGRRPNKTLGKRTLKKYVCNDRKKKTAVVEDDVRVLNKSVF